MISAAHFSRFEFFAKSEKRGPIFREKCEKLRKKASFIQYANLFYQNDAFFKLQLVFKSSPTIIIKEFMEVIGFCM